MKQIPADKAEKSRQIERKESLQEKAKETFRLSVPLCTPGAVTIRCSRRKGRSDSANVIVGVLDSWQGIIFDNDNQVVEISYAGWFGCRDWYQVTVTELAREGV